MEQYTPMSAETLFGLAPSAPDIAAGFGPGSGELFLPERPLGAHLRKWPIVIAIHGGCWRAKYDRSHIRPFCRALTTLGCAVWNIEYRSVGNGGEWPVIFEDVAAAVTSLAGFAELHALDLDRVITVGHSAGGHLALWLAAENENRFRNLSGSPSSQPIKIVGVLSLAGITDLADTLKCGVCTGNIVPLLGGTPDQVSSRYAMASPIQRLPLGVPQILIHGRLDDDVPVDHVRPYVERATSHGDNVALEIVDACGHFELVSPHSVAWSCVVQSLEQLLKPLP